MERADLKLPVISRTPAIAPQHPPLPTNNDGKVIEPTILHHTHHPHIYTSPRHTHNLHIYTPHLHTHHQHIYTPQHSLHTLIPYLLHSTTPHTAYTPHPIPHTSHPTLHTPHPTPHTPHLTTHHSHSSGR